jgi:DNA-binding response OmpR family regulator
VATAATVAEALDLLDPAPACAMLDLRLPDGGGETVLREIRARALRTRVAVFSGSTTRTGSRPSAGSTPS